MGLIPTLVTVGSMVILASGLVATNPTHRIKKDKEKTLKLLQNAIDQKSIELFNIRDRVENSKIDARYNLTRLEVRVLEIYDNSNIRVPVEIVEDLHLQQLEDEADIFKFIESQRKYWKLENSKVPFRKKETQWPNKT